MMIIVDDPLGSFVLSNWPALRACQGLGFPSVLVNIIYSQDGFEDVFIGHRALLIFPLAAMVAFCQIIRKLDLRIFLYFNTITAVMSLIC